MYLAAWAPPCLNPGLRRRLVCSKSKLWLTRKWPNVLINPLFLQKLFLQNSDYPDFTSLFLYRMLEVLLWTQHFGTSVSVVEIILGRLKGQFSATKCGGSATWKECLKLKTRVQLSKECEAMVQSHCCNAQGWEVILLYEQLLGAAVSPACWNHTCSSRQPHLGLSLPLQQLRHPQLDSQAGKASRSFRQWN